MSSDGALPPPLIPLPKRRASDCEPVEEEEGREAPTLPQDLGVSVGLDLGEPEVAVEAYGEMGGSPVQESEQDLSDTELENTGATLARLCIFLIYFNFPSVFFKLNFWFMFPHLAASLPPPPANNHQPLPSQEEFESLFDSAVAEPAASPEEEGPPALSDNDLAVFDPCYKQGEDKCKNHKKKTTTREIRHVHI